MPSENEDAAGSDLRKAVAFVYLGLVWIFAIVILGWVLHRRATKSDNHKNPNKSKVNKGHSLS